MKVLSVKEFKALFGKVSKEKEDILITSRGRPLGIYHPLNERDLRKDRKEIARKLIGIGKGPHNRTSEEHDEELY